MSSTVWVTFRAMQLYALGKHIFPVIVIHYYTKHSSTHHLFQLFANTRSHHDTSNNRATEQQHSVSNSRCTGALTCWTDTAAQAARSTAKTARRLYHTQTNNHETMWPQCYHSGCDIWDL